MASTQKTPAILPLVLRDGGCFGSEVLVINGRSVRSKIVRFYEVVSDTKAASRAICGIPR